MMTSENSILGNHLVVMSRADLDALVEKMASSMAATRVETEDKSTHGNSFCPVVYENERFITREETAKTAPCGFLYTVAMEQVGHSSPKQGWTASCHVQVQRCIEET